MNQQEKKTNLIYCIIFCLIMFKLPFIIKAASQSDELLPSGCSVRWKNDKFQFQAGDIATIRVKVLDKLGNEINYLANGALVNFTLYINDTKGNSSFVSGVSSSFDEKSTSWNMTFLPILVGHFSANVSEDRIGFFGSLLHFNVSAGPIYSSACVASWMDLVTEFVAGSKAKVLILPKDAFGNNISSATEGIAPYIFNISALHRYGNNADILNITSMGWMSYGYIAIEFVVATAGNLLLHVEHENSSLYNTPLPFIVKPGLLEISKCFAQWNYDTNGVRIFSKLQILIYQQDGYGNTVPGFYLFDASVVEKATNLSIPIGDMSFVEVVPGIQLLSFTVSEPGNFSINIFDSEHGSISKMPYEYTVFVGYCDSVRSVVNGSGLLGSVVGQVSSFSVYLQDEYDDPSPVELERIQVQISRKNDSYNLQPNISPLVDADGPDPNHDHISKPPTSTGPTLVGGAPDTIGGVEHDESSSFIISYTTERSGSYDTRVFCGNIPLNGGLPFTFEVSPGVVNTSISSIVKFFPEVKKQARNEIRIKLVDSFMNPVPSQKSKLKLETHYKNSTEALTWSFEEDTAGLFVGYYQASNLGKHKICVLFEDRPLLGCPLEFMVYESNYFPEAINDDVSVWEDESVAFDVLANDRFSDGTANFVGWSKPHHGTILQYGRFFRYTPHKGFVGNDSFNYTISDKNLNIASGSVMILVLISPPRFLSLPVQLQAVEDTLAPEFGGFPGFEMRYSNSVENITVILSAESGSVILSSIPVQVWEPLEYSGSGSGLYVKNGGRPGEALILVGPVEMINSALQSIKYLGNENFCGHDVITILARNTNGQREAHVPILVEPVNDPPWIRVPRYIVLNGMGHKDGLLIFDNKTKDTSDILLGDPDNVHFPDHIYDFTVLLTIEVSAGTLSAILQGDFVDTTEIKPEKAFHWQPLYSVVIIGNSFVVEGKGIRFRGKLKECNIALRQLIYKGPSHDAILTIDLNDMGNYGCYPDCSLKITVPLSTKATIDLCDRKPMTPLLAFFLGAAIIIGFIMTFILGLVLLFFSCKCAFALQKNRGNSCNLSKVELATTEAVNEMLSATSSDNVTYFTGCSSPFLLRRHHGNFHQRESGSKEYLSNT
ncbi:protein GAMETE EXPRESSED 2 isoform X2 [Amborella trichopoda]|uniref:protein GAMETE EXPRESSED 2 isoform X2 n=1 Tax=Amborella trichopoda TaxID=13333 RepID=UPI0009BC96F1|nr:protein GAMETE EXPRESSED 2 isoform X2 [Amborella trichopoda]|eukprot:XP_020523491.1 protein GAMETE EXPRESSED 2 isoform X2 [Amborella trichopoda]